MCVSFITYQIGAISEIPLEQVRTYGMCLTELCAREEAWRKKGIAVVVGGFSAEPDQLCRRDFASHIRSKDNSIVLRTGMRDLRNPV